MHQKLKATVTLLLLINSMIGLQASVIITGTPTISETTGDGIPDGQIHTEEFPMEPVEPSPAMSPAFDPNQGDSGQNPAATSPTEETVQAGSVVAPDGELEKDPNEPCPPCQQQDNESNDEEGQMLDAGELFGWKLPQDQQGAIFDSQCPPCPRRRLIQLDVSIPGLMDGKKDATVEVERLVNKEEAHHQHAAADVSHHGTISEEASHPSREDQHHADDQHSSHSHEQHKPKHHHSKRHHKMADFPIPDVRTLKDFVEQSKDYGDGTVDMSFIFEGPTKTCKRHKAQVKGQADDVEIMVAYPHPLTDEDREKMESLSRAYWGAVGVDSTWSGEDMDYFGAAADGTMEGDGDMGEDGQQVYFERVVDETEEEEVEA